LRRFGWHAGGRRSRIIESPNHLLIHVQLGQRVGKLPILLLQRGHLRVLAEHAIPQRAAPQQRTYEKNRRDPRHRDRQKRRAALRLVIGGEQATRR
jgi:hypothetical protein